MRSPTSPWTPWTLLLLASTSTAAVLDRRIWVPNQVAETMCYWQDSRSVMTGNKIFVDGGQLAFSTPLKGGGEGSKDTLPRQVLYSIDLTRPFTDTTNTSLIFASTPKDAIGVNVHAGALFASETQLVMYGGTTGDSDGLSMPSERQVLRYQLPEGGKEQGKWDLFDLPTGLHRYVSNGASVNVMEEKMGFVFSGLRGKNWSETRHMSRPAYNPTTLSNRLLTLDLSTSARWLNETIPSSIPLRYDARMVWVPRGKKGSLVVIGGVINGVEWRELNAVKGTVTEEDVEESEPTVEGFMTEVAVYDVEAKKWYMQKTNGVAPPALSQHCAVTVNAGELSNIYVLGGRRGLQTTDAFNPNVYVLTLPSFTWALVKEGTPDYARISHTCHRVGPSAILSIGGVADSSLTGAATCLRGGFVQTFDLNGQEFSPSYSPNGDAYEVPKAVLEAIPKDPKLVPAVQKLMDTPYPGKLVEPWPFKKGTPIGELVSQDDLDKANDSDSSSSGGGSSGLPKYIPPLIGTLLGLLVLIIILCLALFYIRRKKSRTARTVTEGSTVRRNRQTWSWLLGVYGNEKAGYANSQEDVSYDPPVESSEGMFVPGDRSSHAHSSGRPPLVTEFSGSTAHGFSHVSSPTASRPTHSRSNTAEISGNAVFELPDTPYVSELDSSTLYDPHHGGKRPLVTEYFAPELPGSTPPGESLALPPPPLPRLDSEEKEVIPHTILPPGHLAAANAGPVPDENGDLPPPPPPKETPPRRSSIEKNTLPPRPETPPNRS